jgi:hypothetical protein
MAWFCGNANEPSDVEEISAAKYLMRSKAKDIQRQVKG